MVIAAEAVMNRMSSTYDPADPMKAGGLGQRFRDQLIVGRSTAKTCPGNTGLMPNPERGCNDLKTVFIDNIFYHRWNKRLGWHLTAAISGAHTIGSAKRNNSGYEGHWSTPADQNKFNNGFYKNMLSHGWGPDRGIGGNTDKNAWQRIDVKNCTSSFKMLMLNTDVCLGWQFNVLHAQCMQQNNRNTGKCNKLQRKGVNNLLAKNNTCCAWLNQGILLHRNIINKTGPNEFCGIKNVRWGNLRGVCCHEEMAGSIGDCDAFNWPKGPAFNSILAFAKDEAEFYKGFLAAWKRATENGFPRPMQKM